jgi:hypothetical protein
MAETKLMSVKIDPNLDRIWKGMGLSPQERTAEIQALDSHLIESYQQFIQQTQDKLEDLQKQLGQAHEEFRDRQRIDGDKSPFPTVRESTPLPGQISAI